MREDSAAARAGRVAVQEEVANFVTSSVSLAKLGEVVAARTELAHARADGMAAFRRLLKCTLQTAHGRYAVLGWLPKSLGGPQRATWLTRGAAASVATPAASGDLWHYTDGLESCGADLLTEVRNAFTELCVRGLCSVALVWVWHALVWVWHACVGVACACVGVACACVGVPSLLTLVWWWPMAAPVLPSAGTWT